MPAIYALHGQLQHPRVWEQFSDRFELNGEQLDVKCPSLWESRAANFEEWTEEFCEDVEKRGIGEKQILLGYSLGGRLALHAVVARPELWRAVILVGAHTGIVDQRERDEVAARDSVWATRFLTEDWEPLIDEWNELPLFGGRAEPMRLKAGEVSRERIASSFKNFTAGKQEELGSKLVALHDLLPLLYLAGAEDTKYHALGESIASRRPDRVEFAIIPDAAHRAPWDNPDIFSRVVNQFLAKI